MVAARVRLGTERSNEKRCGSGLVRPPGAANSWPPGVARKKSVGCSRGACSWSVMRPPFRPVPLSAFGVGQTRTV